ncbi:MAG: XdhC family protein [Gemmatimonadales bacterium]
MKQWLETRQVLDRLNTLVGTGRRAALATVVRVHGSAYRHEGAKLLVADDGSTTGNVSAGCLEQDVREVALLVIESGQARLRTYCSGSEEIAAWDLGLGCEGQIEIFVEPALEARPGIRERLNHRMRLAVCTVVAGPQAAVGQRMTVTDAAIEGSLRAATGSVAARARELLREGRSTLEEFGDCSVFVEVLVPPPQLVICGAGDDAQPLAHFATEVGFQVTVVDWRPAMLALDRFPWHVNRLESRGDDAMGQLQLDEASYAVVMTHGFIKDETYARHLLATEVPYIGILGPHQRTERLLENLEREGTLQYADRARVYGPVGLDIGTDGAEQVALAVIAEILAVQSGRDPRSLRERMAPIHAIDD